MSAKVLASASAATTTTSPPATAIAATSPPLHTPTSPTPVPATPLWAPQPLSGSLGSGGGSFSSPGAGFTSVSSAAASTEDYRRPSPWHDIAHSLSTTSLPPRSRRNSTPSIATPPFAPQTPDSDAESQALRDWDRLLAAPDSDATRHALVTTTSNGSPRVRPMSGTPKLAAERDKDGHIEYKLKLIEPSPERFEKLVTQMMWRLKQGKNEAIYELGLADDGTVIGLTRAEMDASLCTLERMASDVGATVIVLKEIVLTAHTVPDSPTPSSFGSNGSTLWWTRRPDLDENGKPRKGTRGLGGVMPEIKTKKERLAAAREQRERNAAAEVDEDLFESPSTSGTGASDDEPTPFTLDMEEHPLVVAASRADAKRRKAAARREQRRLDLLRGDGTSAMPYTGRSSSPVAEFIGHAPNSTAVLHAARLPHQPMRPSSLRLARTHSGMVALSNGAAGTSPPTDPDPIPGITISSSATAPDTPGPDDAFIDGLSLPLDSLSLSFADVTTMDDSNGGPTAVQSPEDRLLSEEELICVEALVVRKPLNDEWGYRDDNEDKWEFGGEEDGWGFGGDD